VIGADVPFDPIKQRTFAMRFAKLADSDPFHFVKREKFTNGHFYRGIQITFPRPLGFKIPANFSQTTHTPTLPPSGYEPALPPPMQQGPGYVPSSLSPSHRSILPIPSTEPEDNESADAFYSSQPGDEPASSPPRYIPS
jgi:hypothetical protein